MSVSFRLVSKETKIAEGLNSVDEKICNLLNVPVHPKWYGGGHFNWFDSIGFQLAYGLKLDDGPGSVREHYQSSEMWQEDLPTIEKVIDFLQENYVVESWSSWG